MKYKYKTEQREDYRTENQWLTVGYVLKKGARGKKMYASPKSLQIHTYYLPEEVERRSEIKARTKEETAEKVRAYFTEHPKAGTAQAARDLGLSSSTVNKYKPDEFKTPPLTEEEKEQIYAEYLRRKAFEEREQQAQRILSYNALKDVRNYNRYRLHPVEWGRIRANYVKSGQPMPFDCKNGEEFMALMKKFFSTLVDWPLYELCPVCGQGQCIPVWYPMQREPYCGCSEYPACDFSLDMMGEPVMYRVRREEWHPPRIDKDALRRTVGDLSRVICFDAETTGLYADVDEILQLSIVDGNGKVLFDEYIKPKHTENWPQAQAVNGISPEMVANKATIDEHLEQLNAIFASAELLVGYNIFFDLDFIEKAGVDIRRDSRIFDVMREFAPIFAEWDGRRYDYKYQKLETCAAFYGCEPEGKLHNSLVDAKTTLRCYLAMTE